MLPYLCRLEDDVDFGDRPYHGRGGPVPVWRMPRDQWGPSMPRWPGLRSISVTAGATPQRADGHRRLALRHQRPRRRAGHHQRRLPGAGEGAGEPLPPGRHPRRPGCWWSGGPPSVFAPGWRGSGASCAPDGGAVRRGRALARCAAALGHRAGRAGGDLPVGRSLQDHPLAVLWTRSSPRPRSSRRRVTPTAVSATRRGWKAPGRTTCCSWP